MVIQSRSVWRAVLYELKQCRHSLTQGSKPPTGAFCPFYKRGTTKIEDSETTLRETKVHQQASKSVQFGKLRP
jgi:hypothetical protein